MINLPDEVIELILEYLPVQDLLNASTVSKNWYKYIGDSSAFRRKIVINSGLFSSPAISKNRAYESLNVKQFKSNDELVKLLKRHEWLAVYFNVVKISSQKKFVSIIETLNHVKELKIMNVAITNLDKHKKLILPNLVQLVFSDVATDTFETFMAHQPALKSLSLRYMTCDIANPRSIEDYFIDFLKMNSHIKQLELYSDVVNNLFKLDVPLLVPLKLRSLSLNLCDTSQDTQQKISSFLLSQADTLEELRILFQQKYPELRVTRYERWFDDGFVIENATESEECKDLSILFSTWNGLANLKKLTLRFFTNFNDTEVYPSTFKHLKANNNVKVLNIQHINCTIPKKLVQIIMKLCPNLNSLYISDLDKNVITFCAMNLMILRSISYTTANEVDINGYGEMIKTNDGINKFIKFHKEYRG